MDIGTKVLASLQYSFDVSVSSGGAPGDHWLAHHCHNRWKFCMQIRCEADIMGTNSQMGGAVLPEWVLPLIKKLFLVFI